MRQREPFLSEVNNRETIVAIEANIVSKKNRKVLIEKAKILYIIWQTFRVILLPW